MERKLFFWENDKKLEDEEINYGEEKYYFIDAASGNELPYKYKLNGSKKYDTSGGDGYFELKFTVSEDEINLECVSHGVEEEFSYSTVIAEEYVERRTIIEN